MTRGGNLWKCPGTGRDCHGQRGRGNHDHREHDGQYGSTDERYSFGLDLQLREDFGRLLVVGLDHAALTHLA